MHNILFRGKPVNKDDYYFFSQNWKTHCKDGFVYGSLVISHDKYYICVSATCNLKCCINNGITSMIEVIPKTVGEFTNLTDKNDKKIFEGDIVKIMYLFGWDSERENYVPEEEYISKVYSIDACPFCVDLQQCDSDMTPIAWLDWAYDDVEIEIIGNIYDNPGLLEVKPDAD